MSGNFVPYQLRLGKGIDRRLFFHVLLKCSDFLNIKESTYCSMPGPFAEDFKAIYNVLKVRDFIAIENDEDTVNRQRFNWEFDRANFSYRPSETFVRDLDTLNCPSLIIWLDYTKPSEIGEQLREASAVLTKLQRGDVLRITLNANPDALDKKGDDRLIEEKAIDRRKKLLSRVNAQIDLPYEPRMYGAKKYYKVLIRCFKHFANEAMEGSDENFYPFLITTYQDGPHRMMTITGILLTEDGWDEFLRETDIEKLDYATCGWDVEPISIETPSLSDKERLFIDARADLDWNPERIAQDLGFSITRGNQTQQIESIRRYLEFRVHLPYITKTAPGF